MAPQTRADFGFQGPYSFGVAMNHSKMIPSPLILSILLGHVWYPCQTCFASPTSTSRLFHALYFNIGVMGTGEMCLPFGQGERDARGR